MALNTNVKAKSDFDFDLKSDPQTSKEAAYSIPLSKRRVFVLYEKRKFLKKKLDLYRFY